MNLDYLALGFGLILGVFMGSIAMRVLLGKKNQNVEMENFSLKEKANILDESLSELKRDNESKENEIIELNKKLSKSESDLTHLNQKLSEQKEDLQKIQDQFRVEFKNLANDILENNSKKFTEDNRNKMNDLLKPLSDKIKDFEKKVEETYDKESKLRFSLKEEIKRLEELNQQVSKDTVNLTKALKGESKTQGNWGEVVLERILERSGLEKDREYFVQVSLKDDQGKRQQPDIVVVYPGKRHIIIDSKVSLTAYDRFIAAETDHDKEAALKEHLVSLKKHVNELNEKKYQNLYQLNSLDYVMMFLPVEPAYLLAIQKDPELWHYAYNKHIIIISPTNLIAVLKMVESLWRQEYQTRNVQEIARQAGTLYDKFVLFAEDLEKIGGKIDDAKKFYESSKNKLTDGKDSLVRKVENLKSLGVASPKNKKIPKNLLDQAKQE
jgi:DNA recombination protein RmuC